MCVCCVDLLELYRWLWATSETTESSLQLPSFLFVEKYLTDPELAK